MSTPLVDIACCGRMCDRFVENLKNKAIACCRRVSDRFAENLKNKAIVCCQRVSAIALQKTSKINVMTLVLLFSYQIASIFKINPCKTSSPDKVTGDSNTSTSCPCR